MKCICIVGVSAYEGKLDGMASIVGSTEEFSF